MDIPIFTFQLGGQIPDKVIFIIDIIPTLKRGNTYKMKDMYNHYSSIMRNLGSHPDWVNEICTENALICQYKPLDLETVMQVLAEYINYWKELYSKATVTVSEELEIKEITKEFVEKLRK